MCVCVAAATAGGVDAEDDNINNIDKRAIFLVCCI